MALGKFRDIEPDLTKTPFGGGMGAIRFSALLEKRCRCKIAWNKNRLVYIVYRMSGHNVVSFTDLSPHKHFPLVPSLIPMIKTIVNLRNAYSDENPERGLEEYLSRQKRMQSEGIKKYVDDRFPEFKAYASFLWRKRNSRKSRPVVV